MMTMTTREKAIFAKACCIYAAMPGAVQPPQIEVNGRMVTAWGEVDYTPEFKFCEAIALEITASALAAMATAIQEAVSKVRSEIAAALAGEDDSDATVRPN